MEILYRLIEKNGLIFGFFVIALVVFFSDLLAKKLLNNKIPGSAIAILLGLLLAYLGGLVTKGEKGLADIVLFKGVGFLGGAMFRDFAIVASAFGASWLIMKKAGFLGLISLIIGILFFFVVGVGLAWFWGYRDAESLCTIGAGACTYIVGPITGAALGASSEVIALSIAAGVVKAIGVTILTPLVAKKIGLNSPTAAMAYGGLIGTNSGVAAGLAATDPALVPYGSLTATFYTGLGCLLCPSLFYFIINGLLELF
jgi:malonate transporter MadM subunit